MAPTNGTPDPQRLKALVRSIVSTAAPERIILFGSAARGDMHADSDIDLLIIKSNCRTLATAADIYGNLPVGGVEADITVMRPEQVAANAECPSTFVPTALAEGKTIYEHTAIHRPGQSSLLAVARKKQARHREGVQPHQPGPGRTLRIGAPPMAPSIPTPITSRSSSTRCSDWARTSVPSCAKRNDSLPTPASGATVNWSTSRRRVRRPK